MRACDVHADRQSINRGGRLASPDRFRTRSSAPCKHSRLSMSCPVRGIRKLGQTWRRTDPMPGIHWPAALAAAITVIVAAGAAFALNGAEVVQMRRAAFDEMAQVLQFAARNWQEPSAYPDIARAARIIERDARSLTDLFPAGTGASDGYRTAALDAVWSDRQGFDQLA